MSKKQKKIIVLASMFALTFGIVPNVSAMHIMEGYLPGGFCIAWGVICVPFLIAGFMSIKKTLNEHRNLITLLAMSGAFVFVICSSRQSCWHTADSPHWAPILFPWRLQDLLYPTEFSSYVKNAG